MWSDRVRTAGTTISCRQIGAVARYVERRSSAPHCRAPWRANGAFRLYTGQLLNWGRDFAGLSGEVTVQQRGNPTYIGTAMERE